MRIQNRMWKEMLDYVGVYMPLHIPELPDIELPDTPIIPNFYEMYSYYDSAPPTYQHLHHNAIIQKDSTTNTDSPTKDLVDLYENDDCHKYKSKEVNFEHL